MVRRGSFSLFLESEDLFVGQAWPRDDRLVFQRVPPGKYIVRRITFPGQQDLRASFEVPDGARSVEQEVTLQAATPSSAK